MEQDKISCPILFLMFWGQIGVKFNFFEKWTISYNEKTPIKKHAASIKYRNYVLFLLSVIFQITASGCGSQIWTDDLRVMRDLFHILDTFQTYANRIITAILRYFFISTFISLRTAYIILGSVLGSKNRIIFWFVRSCKCGASPYHNLYQPKELHHYNSASNPDNLFA